MTFSSQYRYRYIEKFLADFDNRYISLLTTKFCHYFSINLTLKALLIPSQERLLQTQVILQYYS